MHRKKKEAKLTRKARLSIPKILAWADDYYRRHGTWPTARSGRIVGDETWQKVDAALHSGCRGLPGGSTLATELNQRRGIRVRYHLTRFSEAEIFRWAQAHRQRTGRWPAAGHGLIPESPGDTWGGVSAALQYGQRGLKSGSSLSKFLEKRGIARYGRKRPVLTRQQIVSWAKAFHARHGHWPLASSGPIPESPEDTWYGIDIVLTHGGRGLTERLSLAKLLAAEGLKCPWGGLPLTREMILKWADAYYRKHHEWPGIQSGAIPESPGDTWKIIDLALRKESRTLRRKISLFTLLKKYRGAYRGLNRRPMQGSEAKRLGMDKVKLMANAHRKRTGAWPHLASGEIPGENGLTWRTVDMALRIGYRGLPGGTSLARMFGRKPQGPSTRRKKRSTG